MRILQMVVYKVHSLDSVPLMLLSGQLQGPFHLNVLCHYTSRSRIDCCKADNLYTKHVSVCGKEAAFATSG